MGRQAFRGRLPQAPGHAADRRRQDDRTRRAADHRSTSEDPAVLEQPFASAGTSHTGGPIRSRAAGSSASSKWMRTAETEAWTSTGRCLFIRHSRRHSGSQPLRPTGTRTSLIGFLAVLITIGPATAQPAGRTTAVDHLRSLEVECGRAFGHESALPPAGARPTKVTPPGGFPASKGIRGALTPFSSRLGSAVRPRGTRMRRTGDLAGITCPSACGCPSRKRPWRTAACSSSLAHTSRR